MKTLNQAFCFLSFMCLYFQCSSTKPLLEENAPFTSNKAYFQEWYAGIKVGGSGVNIYFPNLDDSESIVIDSVYFQKMKGKLTKGRARYSAVLMKPDKHYANISSSYEDTSKKRRKEMDFPFLLKEDECVISYFQNGERKFVKIKGLIERRGIYYEDGPVTSID